MSLCIITVIVSIFRKDLIGSEDAAVGIAFLGGACNYIFSGALVQDVGLASGQAIAHELGHS